MLDYHLTHSTQYTRIGSHSLCRRDSLIGAQIHFFDLFIVTVYFLLQLALSSSSFEINCSFLLWEQNQLEKETANWRLSWRSRSRWNEEEKKSHAYTNKVAKTTTKQRRDSRNCFLITHQKINYQEMALHWKWERRFSNPFFIHKKKYRACLSVCSCRERSYELMLHVGSLIKSQKAFVK